MARRFVSLLLLSLLLILRLPSPVIAKIGEGSLSSYSDFEVEGFTFKESFDQATAQGITIQPANSIISNDNTRIDSDNCAVWNDTDQSYISWVKSKFTDFGRLPTLSFEADGDTLQLLYYLPDSEHRFEVFASDEAQILTELEPLFILEYIDGNIAVEYGIEDEIGSVDPRLARLAVYNIPDRTVNIKIRWPAIREYWQVYLSMIAISKTEDNQPDEKLVFEDCMLRQALISSGYDTDSDGEISSREILEVDCLDISGMGITSLQGLEYAVNLTTLIADNNQISELTPLAGLENLVDLELADNKIVNIHPLAGCRNLVVLNLSKNLINELFDFGILENLSYLNLSSNSIEDISGIKNNSSLIKLDLSHNLIDDIECIAALLNLNWLDLRYNMLDISAGSRTRAVLDSLNISRLEYAPQLLEAEPLIITIQPFDRTPTNKDITVYATVNRGELNVSSYTFTENGYFKFTATDDRGNYAEQYVYVINIDKTPPVIILSDYNTNPTNQDITVYAMVNEGELNREYYTFTENGSFTFVAVDSVGNTACKTVSITNIDKTPPVITIQPYPQTPTNKSITVHASTNEGSLNRKSYTFTENGSFTFVAVDSAGNRTERTVTISNINKTGPRISIHRPDGSIINNSETVNSQVWLTVYDYDKLEITKDKKAVDPNLRSFSDNGEYTVMASDSAGNKTKVSFKIVNIPMEIKADLIIVSLQSVTKSELVWALNTAFESDYKIFDPNGRQISTAAVIGSQYLAREVRGDMVLREFRIVIRGDLNSNGVIDFEDYHIVKQLTEGDCLLAEPLMQAANLDGSSDAAVTQEDLIILKELLFAPR